MSEDEQKKAMKKMGRLMTANMPLTLKARVALKMMLAGRDDEKRRKVMQEIKGKRKFTVSRDKIEWYPRIDQEMCQKCGVCLGFCPTAVFTEDSQDKAILVTNPYRCVVLCSGCEVKCPHGAISFPDRKDFYDYVYYV